MSEPQAFSKLAYVSTGQSRSVDRNEWYTPAKYIEAARDVMGVIDFDPYSDHVANQTVKASVIRTKPAFQLLSDKDHVLWPACKTVFMNPPYGKGLIENAVNEFLFEENHQQFNAVVLVNNATETRWFQSLLNACDAFCFTDHRIAFNSVDGKAISGNTRGQAFFYFGTAPHEFVKRFAEFGYSDYHLRHRHHTPGHHDTFNH